jgi:Ternary complex associated domain 7/CHAT domain
MPARAALIRLARHGFWKRSTDTGAREWLEEYASRKRVSTQIAEVRLRRAYDMYAVAIRRQWYANILWYSRSVSEVLARCLSNPESTVLVALNLHEPDSRPTVPLETASFARPDNVVLDGLYPVGVGALTTSTDALPRRGAPPVREKGFGFGAGVQHPEARASHVRAWPRLDAPSYVAAQQPFTVLVGLGDAPQTGVSGTQIVLNSPGHSRTVPLTIVLVSEGIDASDGWSKPLDVDLDNPKTAFVQFTLVGRTPESHEPVRLMMIEARYVRDGSVIGSASRPIVIGPSTASALQLPDGPGMKWLAQPPATPPFEPMSVAPTDLTIDLSKPDRNASAGSYLCFLHSPHALSVPAGPYPIDLGEDAKTFAKMVVDQVRQYGDDPIVDNLLESVGDLVAARLPHEVFQAVRDVGQHVSPHPPSVLIRSAEPYVPWELARMTTPLDPSRPPYLGAQVLLGRWLQDADARPGDDGTIRPPQQPPHSLPMKHLAVMAGRYRADSGLRSLPKAEDEAQTLVTTYEGIRLAASLQQLKRLLDAQLLHESRPIGGADAVHFAGHGEFDPARQDASVLFLDDGRPLSSLVFRSAKYGGAQQPLLFLNACMIGIGGQLLGDVGGFPGNCLKGGFGALLGALWEVDDDVAHDIAIEFWRRAMPSSTAPGEPIGAILRDVRAKYLVDGTSAPESTFLAYVYYGHPTLTLHRAH